MSFSEVSDRVVLAGKYLYYLWILMALAPVLLILTPNLRPLKFGDVTGSVGWLYFVLYLGIIEVLLTGRDLDEVIEIAKNRGERP